VQGGNSAYRVGRGGASSGGPHYAGANRADVPVTNADNDVAGIDVGAISGGTTEAGGSATFTVVLKSQPTADVTIPVSSNNTAEGTVSAPDRTCAAEDWNVRQSVTVTGVDDHVRDGHITYDAV